MSACLGQEAAATPTIKDVMLFLTGCGTVPPMGYGDATPSIMFIANDEDEPALSRKLPTVSTCSLTLRFPYYMQQLDVTEFKEKMDFAILGSQGFFGQV